MIYAHAPLAHSSLADRMRASGLRVGDRIQYTERVAGGLRDVRLTLLWVGEELAVWRVCHRYAIGPWCEQGETASWDPRDKIWSRVDDSDS